MPQWLPPAPWHAPAHVGSGRRPRRGAHRGSAPGGFRVEVEQQGSPGSGSKGRPELLATLCTCGSVAARACLGRAPVARGLALDGSQRRGALGGRRRAVAPPPRGGRRRHRRWRDAPGHCRDRVRPLRGDAAVVEQAPSFASRRRRRFRAAGAADASGQRMDAFTPREARPAPAGPAPPGRAAGTGAPSALSAPFSRPAASRPAGLPGGWRRRARARARARRCTSCARS